MKYLMYKCRMHACRQVPECADFRSSVWPAQPFRPHSVIFDQSGRVRLPSYASRASEFEAVQPQPDCLRESKSRQAGSTYDGGQRQRSSRRDERHSHCASSPPRVSQEPHIRVLRSVESVGVEVRLAVTPRGRIVQVERAGDGMRSAFCNTSRSTSRDPAGASSVGRVANLYPEIIYSNRRVAVWAGTGFALTFYGNSEEAFHESRGDITGSHG